MAGNRLPRWVFSWLYRWYPWRVRVRRHPVVRHERPMLEILEERGSPTAIALPAQAEFASTHLTQLDNLLRSRDGETRTAFDRAGVTDSATLRLVSLPSQSKTEDRPSRPMPPAEPAPFLYSFRSRGESTPDDFSRTMPTRHAPSLASPQRQQGANNNSAALAGAGGGSRGAPSTPNAVGGGAGASGGGGGSVTNANQFLSALANQGGSALTPATVSPTATPAAAPMVQPADATRPQATSPALDDPAQGSSLISSTFGGGQAGASQAPSGPLYVLDMNTGETLPANITLNTFST